MIARSLMLLTATLLACFADPESPHTEKPARPSLAGEQAPVLPGVPTELGCWVTHTSGIFQPYRIAPEVGDMLAISLEPVQLQSLTELRFQDGFSNETAIELPGPAMLADTLGVTTLTSTSSDSQSSLVMDIVTDPTELDSLAPELDALIWLRLLQSGLYVSHARLECSSTLGWKS